MIGPPVFKVTFCDVAPFDQAYVTPGEDTKVTFEPIQKLVEPTAEIVATGFAKTLMTFVEDAEQPFAVNWYEIVAEPTPVPLTEPAALIAATEPFELVQAPPDVEFVNGVLEPKHTLFAPEITGTTGNAVTVTVVGKEVVEHPFASVIV